MEENVSSQAGLDCPAGGHFTCSQCLGYYIKDGGGVTSMGLVCSCCPRPRNSHRGVELAARLYPLPALVKVVPEDAAVHLMDVMRRLQVDEAVVRNQAENEVRETARCWLLTLARR